MKSADRSTTDQLQLLALRLNREDVELRWMLVGLAAAFLGEVVVVNLRGGAGLFVLLSAWLAGIALFLIAVFRLRSHRYSADGLLFFCVTIAIFQGWTAVVSWVAVLTWSSSWTVFYLGLVEASAVIPLLTGIYLMSRRLT